MIGAWVRETDAPPSVRFVAESLRPKLGQPCHRIGMSSNGTRYAFVFDNPSKGYWWMKLPPTPAQTGK